MRMNQDERRFDFHGLGLALKRAREEKGWTQAYVAELVDRDSRTIMNIENKGQYPSFDLFVKLITMFDVSVDQFIHADGGARSSSCRKHIDVLLNSMNEKELSSYESLLTIEVIVYFCFIVITTCYRSIIQCREHIASYVAYLCSIVAKAFQHILHRMKIYLLQSAPYSL